MEINQGEIYWLALQEPGSLEAGIPHPHIIIQEDVFNHSRVNTGVVSQVSSVDKTRLGGYIGSPNEKRIRQILAGVRFLQRIDAQHGSTEDR